VTHTGGRPTASRRPWARHAVYVNACLINHRLFIHFLVRLAFRPSKGAPKGPQLATTLASSSTTLALTPRRQRLTTVGGCCAQSSSRSQPVLILVLPFSGVSVAQKRMDGKNWYVGPKTSNEHTTKTAPLGHLKPSIPRSTRTVRAHIPTEQTTTVTLSVRGHLDGRSARSVYAQGSPGKGRPYVLYQACSVFVFCTIGLVQNVWAALPRQSLQTSS
jgi:hypothetical protein